MRLEYKEALGTYIAGCDAFELYSANPNPAYAVRDLQSQIDKVVQKMLHKGEIPPAPYEQYDVSCINKRLIQPSVSKVLNKANDETYITISSDYEYDDVNKVSVTVNHEDSIREIEELVLDNSPSAFPITIEWNEEKGKYISYCKDLDLAVLANTPQEGYDRLNRLIVKYLKMAKDSGYGYRYYLQPHPRFSVSKEDDYFGIGNKIVKSDYIIQYQKYNRRSWGKLDLTWKFVNTSQYIFLRVDKIQVSMNDIILPSSASLAGYRIEPGKQTQFTISIDDIPEADDMVFSYSIVFHIFDPSDENYYTLSFNPIEPKLLHVPEQERTNNDIDTFFNLQKEELYTLQETYAKRFRKPPKREMVDDEFADEEFFEDDFWEDDEFDDGFDEE